MKASNSALIYCRVSTAGQEDRTSLADQERDCRTWAAKHGYVVEHVYRETFTGAELERPALDTLRNRVRAGGIAAVVVYCIDRLSRGQGFTPVLMTEFLHRGCELRFVTDPPEDTDEGKLFVSIREYLAAAERRKIVQRTTRGKRALAQQGILCAGSVPLYSYRKDLERRARQVYEPEAAVVRDIFRLAAAGEGLHAIARHLNAAGVPTRAAGKFTYQGERPRQHRPPSGRWSHKSVSDTIRNPSYKGETAAYLGVEFGTDVTPAIVDEATWERAQARGAPYAPLADARRRNAERPHLLRALVYCATCNRRMRPDYMPCRGRNGKVYPGHWYYRCPSRHMSCGPCGARSAREDGLDAFVWRYVEEALGDPQAIVAEIRQRWAEGPDRHDAEDLEEAERKLRDLSAQEAKLVRLYARLGEGGPSLDAVERELRDLGKQRETWSETAERAKARLAQDKRELAEIAALGFEGRRRACEKLGVAVTAGSEEWDLSFHIPCLGERGGVTYVRGEARRSIFTFAPGVAGPSSPPLCSPVSRVSPASAG
jgi:site-specific DNA recombinase